MLIFDSYLAWLVLAVGILSSASVVALFTREVSRSPPVRPVILSAEDRKTLEKMTFELRKRERQEIKRKQQQRLAREVSGT